MSERLLTTTQRTVLLRLRNRDLDWNADQTERCWRAGLTWYIDRRVDARGIRRLFNQGNREALLPDFRGHCD
jgi:hypothetical protein